MNENRSNASLRLLGKEQKKEIIAEHLEDSAQCFGDWVCEQYPNSERQKVAAVYSLFEPMLRRRFCGHVTYMEDGKDKIWIVADDYNLIKYRIFLGCDSACGVTQQKFELLIQRLSYYFYIRNDYFERDRRFLLFDEWMGCAGIKLKDIIWKEEDVC